MAKSIIPVGKGVSSPRRVVKCTGSILAVVLGSGMSEYSDARGMSIN